MATPFTVPIASKVQAIAAVRPLHGIFVSQPTEKVESNETIFLEGRQADHIFEVMDGVVRLYKLLPDGRRAITGFLYPGDLFGLSVRDSYLYTAESVTRVSLRRYPRTRFGSLLTEDPALARQLLGLLCHELSAAQEQILLLGRKNAQERVASFLLAAARRLPGRPEGRSVVLPMTRQDMADYLGLTIETVSRTITKLRKDGVIVLLDAQRVLIRDDDELRALAAASRRGPARYRPAAGLQPEPGWAN